MAKVLFVEERDLEVLRKYLAEGDAVLIYPEQQSKVSDLGLSDGDETDYEFGGDCDIQLDIVASKEHHFIHQTER
ncbi:hypothetical protein AB4254_10990 [Vibrio breoganii]